MIKTQRQFTCDIPGCTTPPVEKWCSVGASTYQSLPDGWEAFAEKRGEPIRLCCGETVCKDAATSQREAGQASREADRAAALEAGSAIRERRARKARQKRIARERPRPGDEEAEAAAVAAEAEE